MHDPMEALPGGPVPDSPVPESEVAGDERMQGVELQCVREYLGLTAQALADQLQVSARTVQHWEAGKYAIPDGVRLAVEAIEADTAQCVGILVERLMDMPDPAVSVCRTEARYRAVSPVVQYTARWHRHVVMRVAAEVPGLRIVED